MPNPPQVVETPLGGGLLEQVHEAHRPFGELTIAKNIRQPKNGLIAKRPGNSKLTNQFQQANNAGAATLDVSKGGALAAYGGQLLIHTNAGVSAYSSAFATFGTLNPGSEASVRRASTAIPSSVIANTKISFKMPPAMATDGTYYAYVWVTTGGVLYVNVEEIATGSLVQEQIQPSPGASNVAWASVFFLSGKLCVVWVDTAKNLKLGTLASPYTNAGGAGFTVTTLAVTSADSSCTIDAIPIDATHFAVSWLSFGSSVLVKAWDTAGVVLWGGIAISNQTATVDTRLSVSNGTVWCAANQNGSTFFVVKDFSVAAGASTLPANGFQVSASFVDSHAVMGYTSANQCVIAWSKSDTTRAVVVDKSLSAGAGGFVIDGTANPTASTSLASRPFMQGGKTYVWLQTSTQDGLNGSIVGSEWGISNSAQFTWVLCDTRLDVAQTGFAWPMRPVAVDSPRFAFPIANRNTTGPSSSASPLSICNPSANKWITTEGFRQTAYVAPWAKLTVDFADSARWRSVTLGNLLLTSSGMVLNWDGGKAFENGFLNHAILGSLSFQDGAGVGSLVQNTLYWYRIVPMYIDDAGNVHRGIPSPLVSHTTGAGKTQIVITFPQISLTDKTPLTGTSSTVAKYPAFYEIYRSQGGASGGVDVATNFVDIVRADFGGGVTTFTDGILDGSVANNARCYTFGGALPNGCPPGALDIVAHQGRAWVISDDANNLYFTKQIVDGEAVNFTDSFTSQLDANDANALASMDDKLIVFSKKKIFYQVGFGPGDDGTGSDYQGFTRIQSPVGCVDRRSVVATPDGVFFQSPIGIYLLTRGLEVVYIGQPVADEIAAFPVVVAAILHPTQPWVYFYVTNSAGNAGERLVYDYRVQKWCVDTLPGVPLSATSTSDGTHYWLDTTGQVWQETPASYLDNGAYVISDWETTLHAVGIDGWQNIARLQLLFNRITPHDLTVQTRPMYGSTYDTPPDTWNDVALSAMSGYLGRAGQIGQIEIVPQSSKVNAVAIRVTDGAPTGGAALGTGQGPQFFALAALTQPEPAALALVSDAQRGT